MVERRQFRAGGRGARQSGMGMIEVLVALLVLAIGLLGVLGMENKGVQLNQAGYYQSQAMFMAQDILERIRANKKAIDDYVTGFSDTITAPSTDCLSDTATCTPAQMAASDLYHWKVKSLQKLLPSGEGKVDVTQVGGDLYRVDVQIKYVAGKLSSGGNTYAYYKLSAQI